MPLHVALTHKTSYHYDRLVALGPQTIRLRPAPQARTSILSYELTVEPKPHFINWMQDPQGNHLARVVFPEKVDRFEVTVDLVADMVTINPFDFFLEPEAETWPFSYDPVLEQELAPFRKLESPGPLLTALLKDIPRTEVRTVDKLVALNSLVQGKVAYIVRLEPGVYTPEETLDGGKGSCRDSAWLLVQVLRNLGMAARFVSGYLIQLVADVKPLEGPQGPTSDFTDLHAWAEVYLPGAGWVGLDATSGLLCGEGHIPLAASPDPISAAPISGMVEKAETTFGFEMAVRRIKETPRTTMPYTDTQWQAILARGQDVDRALKRSDVRLTMGGEPTFIAADDMDAPEWNTDALGPTKRAYAGRLIRRLMDRWASGAVLNNSMGKQYPGEQLPRWALHCHWRADGEKVWNDPALLASDDDTDNATAAEAAAFAASLAERLQVDPALVIPAYEDIHYYLWKEHRLPANVLAEDSKLGDPLERARLARVYAQGLSSTVGSVLPLRRVMEAGTRRWQSGKWFFKAGEMFLIPGDSPLGLRLPLESLPWVDPDKAEYDVEPDPFAPKAKLPTRQALQSRSARGEASSIENFRPVQQELPVIGQGDPSVVRTALAVEARDGLLHVFFPPVFAIEDWLALTAAVEETAAEIGRKVVLEGYLPPEDERLLHFSVTPDPGVIEVNTHPTSSWAEQIQLTEELYEEARQDSLAELEIAFAQVKAKQPVAPWVTDRLFRHILADMTGNTHRTEFCIDKMYSPDSASGRRGLVECRAFEMPPHARMSAAQVLLMRSAVAAFWERPYERSLVHWGTRVHDDFMLPHFVEQDFRGALEEISGLGFPMDPDWFAPHLAFRFPHIGTVDFRGMELELRNALEPWHVLGEEQAAGGTVRYVDSSVERVQARVSGWVDERYVLTANGTAVPLTHTDREGEYVGGIRFKAWNPPSALHPTIGVHAPLVLDVYDRWSGRSLGGLTYHISHPGGRSYDTFPVNANEAEARRRARFFPFGHTPGPMREPVVQRSREHPRTLDLRRV